MTPWFLEPNILPLINLGKKHCYHEIRFEKDTRYYVMRLGKDLFDDWVITLVNGRIKSKLGQIRTLPFSSFEEGFEHLCDQTKLRNQREYRLTNILCDNFALHLLPFFCQTQPESHHPNPKKATPRKTKQIKCKTISAQSFPQQLGFLF